MGSSVENRERFAAVYDDDMALALRAEGVAVHSIATIYGVAISAVWRRVKGVVPAVDLNAFNLIALQARNRAARQQKGDATKAAVAKYRAAGMQFRDVALMVGITSKHAQAICPKVKPRHWRAGKSLAARKAAKSVYSAEQKIPRWVVRADLVDDFRDITRDFGRDRALRDCRRLAEEAARICL